MSYRKFLLGGILNRKWRHYNGCVTIETVNTFGIKGFLSLQIKMITKIAMLHYANCYNCSILLFHLLKSKMNLLCGICFDKSNLTERVLLCVMIAAHFYGVASCNTPCATCLAMFHYCDPLHMRVCWLAVWPRSSGRNKLNITSCTRNIAPCNILYTPWLATAA